MKRIFDFIKPYLFVAFCFIVSILLTKTIEAFATDIDISFGTYMRSLAVNLITSGIVCIVIFPVYLAISFISKKGALLTSCILLSIVLLSEISFTIYTAHNGTLLGAELIVRPVAETLISIKGAFGIFVPIISIIAIVAGFTTIVMLLSKLKIHNGIPISALVGIVLSLPCSFLLPKLKLNNEAANVYIYNKNYFFVCDCISYLSDTRLGTARGDKIEYNKKYVDEYLADNPEFQAIDTLYPMERIDRTPDVLSKYFTTNGKKPNVVIILVESLGHEFVDPCFAPFIDSLAQTGLYWTNCLSTTNRSFGAIPAITASVTGPNGFQFGTMPQHNSLISLLNENGYRSNVFYAGYWTFDCIYEFLTAQHTAYMSPLYQEYTNIGDDKLGTWWGYHDEILLDKTFDVIKNQGDDPNFNLIVTLSSHDKLNLSDEQKEELYVNKAKQISSKYGNDIKQSVENNKLRYAGIVYTDDCIRKFMNKYRTLPQFENTIFIITGDHSSGIRCDDNLSFHRVPLIIWSPLLDSNDNFNSVVTHNDIMPSIIRLLKNTFGLSVPATTHTIGTGLTTSKEVTKTKRMVIVGYDHSKDMVYDNYYIDAKANQLYLINDDLKLERVDDAKEREQIRHKLDVYSYIYNYAYTNNALTSRPIYADGQYDTIAEARHEEIVCENPDRKPSEAGSNTYLLLAETTIPKDKGYRNIRFSIKAKVFTNDSMGIRNTANIMFVCQNKATPTYSPDKISRYIDGDKIIPGHEYALDLKKTFSLDTESDNIVSISVVTANHDDCWIPDIKMTMKDIKITVECSK